MRRLVFAFALGCGGTPSQGSDDDKPPAPPAKTTAAPGADEIAGFLVLGSTARLHQRPSGESAQLEFDAREPGDFNEVFAAFEVLGNEAQWIHIRNLSAESGDAHCVGGWSALADFEVDFWVRRVDLHAVVRRPVFAKFDDGTSVKLGAGAPVVPASAEGTFVALGPGARAELPLDADAIGAFYRPSALYKPGASLGTMPRSTGLVLGGNLVGTEALRGPETNFDVFAKERREAGTLVTAGSRCAEIRALARGKAPELEVTADAEIAEATARLRALGSLGETGGPKFAADAGAEVFWPDGETAGRLVAAHTFVGEPLRKSDKRCFRVKGLSMCVRADDMSDASPTVPTIAGHGAAGGALGAVPSAKAALAAPTIKGALPKLVVVRVMKGNIAPIRNCYAKGLLKDKSLKGTVKIQFTIGPTGKVPVAVVASTTLKDRTVANCVAKTIKRLRFPKPPGGGNAVVTYPFAFSP